MILDLFNGPDFIRITDPQLSVIAFTSGIATFNAKSFEIKIDTPIQLEIPLGSHVLSFSHKYNQPASSKEPLLKSITILRLDFNINSLRIQTIMPKWCKDLNQIVQVAIDSNFNAVHFTPPQLRGSSNSPYSLKDHLGWHEFNESDFKSLPSNIKYFVDVVWNHVSPDSLWLQDHPECGYNLSNTPELQLAFLVDHAILSASAKCAPEFNLNNTMSILNNELQAANILSYMSVNAISTSATPIELVKMSFDQFLHFTVNHGIQRSYKPNGSLLYSNFHQYILANQWNYDDFLSKLNFLISNQINNDIQTILTNVQNTLQYQRLDPNGPLLGPISSKSPIMRSYFAQIGSNYLLCNGWVWGNVEPSTSLNTTSYYLRQVIVWGDCVKCNYGYAVSDNPALYAYMKQYTTSMASIFDGFRIDNCHSTPIHVAKYLLESARSVNPNIYIYAELFTGNESTDKHFVKELGLHSLIREGMQCDNSTIMSHILYKYSGEPLGSLAPQGMQHMRLNYHKSGYDTKLINYSDPHALLYDMTHDNKSVSTVQSPVASVSHCGLVAFSTSAIASTRGYDEIVKSHVDVVVDTRHYLPLNYKQLMADYPMFQLRSVFNKYHELLLDYTEIHVHQENDYIHITRINPNTLDGYLLVARTNYPNANNQEQTTIKLLKTRAIPVLMASINDIKQPESSEFINGQPHALQINEFDTSGLCLTPYNSYLKSIATLDSTLPFTIHNEHIIGTILTCHIQPGAILLFKTRVNEHKTIRELGFLHYPLSNIINGVTMARSNLVDSISDYNLTDCFTNINLVELNILLFRTPAEDNDHGISPYHVPNTNTFIPYGGIQGFISLLETDHVIKYNQMGHGLYENIRQGSWLMDWIINRLVQYEGILNKTTNETSSESAITKIIQWLRIRCDALSTIPRYLVPRYFTAILYAVYEGAINKYIHQLPNWVHNSHILTQLLSLTAVQMTGISNRGGLTPTNPISMSAGLPHFTMDYMRCWGRDVFISMNGLYSILGHLELAKQHIIGFGATVKHGLIPNLLNRGEEPRFNCRDAVWFWIIGIIKLVEQMDQKETIALLETPIKRRFNDNSEWNAVEEGYKRSTKLIDIIIECIDAHYNDIEFIEHNHGSQLDQHMQNEGFQIKIVRNKENGLIYGGNKYNCGTWMDKMGSFGENRGWPSTPRDGANIEINGMLFRALKWVNSISKLQLVSTSTTAKYKAWSDQILASFDSLFFIKLDDQNPNVKQRGYYKDTLGCSNPKACYDIRPNVFIAMVVAPELFNMKHYAIALETGKCLVGPLGMKTVSPHDIEQYRGYYDNSSTYDTKTGGGWNYHQGKLQLIKDRNGCG